MTLRARIIQIIIILVAHTLTLAMLAAWMPGLQIDSWGGAILVAVVLLLAESLYWWLFVSFFSWLPVWLFPLVTFFLSGAVVLGVSSFMQSITVESIFTGMWIALALTAVNAILGGLLSIDLDESFDRNVTLKMVKRRGQLTETDEPGFLFLEIDGLGEAQVRKAIDEGHMPNLKRWIESGTHQIIGWEAEFTSQTGAMQSGILLGNNDDVPAYRWWDREQGRVVMSGMPKDAQQIEARLSNGRGLCSEGGSSRGNMFSGDASESMLTFSSLLNRQRGRGPGFYSYLLSPYVIARLITRFLSEVILEWWQAFQQRRRKDPYRISARNPGYALLRAFLSPFMQDLVTYIVIGDMLRGLPAVYALYAGYDDLAHFAGMHSPEMMEALHEIDRYFGRIERAMANAPRPYHIVVLSDHGQTLGFTFENAHGVSLEKLVKGLVGGDAKVAFSEAHSETWDGLNAFLSEATDSEERSASIVSRMIASRQREDHVEVGPKGATVDEVSASAQQAQVVVMGSGSTGLIYFTDSKQRMTYEQIQDAYPQLIPGLIEHPGVGFVLVRSKEQGDLVLSLRGVHYLEDGHVDREDPLTIYGPNAAMHLRRESSFSNCPDLVVSSVYDPQKEEMCCFENQVSHHGGLGGPQNHPFILAPTAMPYDGQPVIGAMGVYRLLRSWRAEAQGIAGP